MSKILTAPEISVADLPDQLFVVEPKQEEYDGFFNQLLQPFVTIESAEVSAEGDIVRLALTGSFDGTFLEMPFHLAKPFHTEEVIATLTGRKVGDSFGFNYKDGAYFAEVLSVKRRIQAELTDELAAKIAFDGTSTSAELKKKLHEQIVENARQERLQSAIGAVKNHLLKTVEFELDETEIDKGVQRLMNELDEMMPKEEQEAYLLGHFKLTDPQKIPEEIRAMASRNIRNELLSSYYGKDADVSDAAYEARVQEYTAGGMSDEEVRSQYPKAAFVADAYYDAFIAIIENCCKERWQIHDAINE